VGEIDYHHDHRLDVLELTIHDAHRLLFLEEPILLFRLELEGALGLLLDALEQFLLAFFEEGDEGVGEDELTLDFGLGVVELRWFFFDGVGDGGLFLEHFVDDPAGLGDVGVVALNFGSAVGHAVDGLVDDDGGVRLLHDLVDLVALGADQQRHHPLGHENDHRKGLLLRLLEGLVDVAQHGLRALVLLLHLHVVHLTSPPTTYVSQPLPGCCAR
jgi:hypothetical protein